MRKFVLLVLTMSAGGVLFAQSGYLRGKVLDQETGEELIGATVMEKGTTNGTVTDFNGDFSLTLSAGTHSVYVQFVSFQPVTVEGVVIKAGEVTSMDVTLSEDVQQLESVVVSAEQIKDNEVALLSVQKKSINTIDGITAASFRKIGDNNLSAAMNRVTGVTVQDGKYVYVRGLGDRYTRVLLNGMVIPGIDPDRNDFPIDLFPTTILENVIVYKNFTPDLYGDFAGGLVDVQTKAFPVEKQTVVTVGTGYNPAMNLNSDYLSYSGTSKDWTGLGASERKLPISTTTDIPTTKGDEVAELTRKFSPVLGATNSTSFLNTNFSVTHRNQIQGDKLTWGYNAILSYRNNYFYYDDAIRKRYELRNYSGTAEMERDYTAEGGYGKNEVIWSALASLAAKTANHTIGTQFMRLQNGITETLQRDVDYSSLNNPADFTNDILAYKQRSLTNNITYGKHSLGDWRIDWTNSVTYSSQNEPDYRNTLINNDNGRYTFSNGGEINRFWRELKQWSEAFKLDINRELNENNKIKFGGAMTYSARKFDIYSYDYQPLSSFIASSDDANDLLKSENLYSSDNTSGLYIQDNSNSLNDYRGSQMIWAGYAMNEMKITERFKSIYGVRLEAATMHYTGDFLEDDNSTTHWSNRKTMDNVNFLPSVNLVYAINDDMNLRGSFSKTLARPTFKEKSEAYIEDPILLQTFKGNIHIKQASVYNYDLRWEYFFHKGEKVAVSAFYKDFSNHIAYVYYANNTKQLTPRNVGSAMVYGTELEFMKNLGFMGYLFKNVSLGSNVTLAYSRVDRKTVKVDDDGGTEYEAEVDFLGTEKGVKRYRSMSGQSPYVINAFLSYSNNENGWDVNLTYNVSGETMSIVGITTLPNVYTKPYNDLMMRVSKTFGSQKKSNLALTVRNMLNRNQRMVYKYHGEERIFQKLNPGQRYSLTYTYNF